MYKKEKKQIAKQDHFINPYMDERIRDCLNDLVDKMNEIIEALNKET